MRLSAGQYPCAEYAEQPTADQRRQPRADIQFSPLSNLEWSGRTALEQQHRVGNQGVNSDRALGAFACGQTDDYNRLRFRPISNFRMSTSPIAAAARTMIVTMLLPVIKASCRNWTWT